MEKLKLEETIIILPKSKIKAGDGKKKGKYPLYRCSNKIDTYYDEYIIDIEAIIIGTGGNPSIHYNTGKCAYTTQCLAITSKGVLKNKYIYYYLLSQLDRIQNMFRGMTIKQLDKKEFFKLEIPIIEVEIQDKIIENLDIIANNIQSKKEQLKKLEQLIKSQFVEMFGIPFLNDKNWKHGIIKDLVREVKYGTSKPANGGKYKYLRMNNITYDGKLDLREIKYIDIEESDKEKYSTKNGDILFNRTNSKELVGKTCVFDIEEEMIIAGFIIRVRINEFANPYFISEYMNTVYLKEKLRNMCKDASGQSNINAKELENIKIYIPPITLQNQFSEIVKQIDKQKFEIEKSLKETQELYESLIEEYFNKSTLKNE